MGSAELGSHGMGMVKALTMEWNGRYQKIFSLMGFNGI